LQLFSISLNSCGARPDLARFHFLVPVMDPFRVLYVSAILLGTAAFAHAQAPEANLELPPGTSDTIDKIYSFDLEAALQGARNLQQERPDHPLGYLLESEAIWWKIWCTTADFKYGMTEARRRPKLAADQHYFDVAAKVSSTAEAQVKAHETAGMQFYAGMGDALAARLHGLRGESRATARAGVRARAHFLRAVQLEPGLADADFGLGLYNYYVDTLSALARFLRFFMGIPGGSKQDGVGQLQHAIADGVLTPSAARFYLAINLHRYDEQYERALAVLGPLSDKYPSNPLFQLARGDLYAKLNRKDQALDCYRAAAALSISDPECRDHIQKLLRASLANLGVKSSSP
jgi:tetratricopeptide (TPR) repeat protein